MEETNAAVAAEASDLSARASRIKEDLRSRYQLRSEFLSVPLMARILGVGETTIYDYIRQRRFAVPCRMFNKSPKAALDDFAMWMASGRNVVLASPRAHESRVAAPPSAARPEVDAAIRETIARLRL